MVNCNSRLSILNASIHLATLLDEHPSIEIIMKIET